MAATMHGCGTNTNSNMRCLSTASSLAGPSSVPRRPRASVQCIKATAQTEADQMVLNASSKAPDFDARAFRRSLNQSGRYVRKTMNDADSLQLMEDHGVGYSSSGLVAQMRESGFAWQQGNTTVKLAQAYGFCWGVERAVQMAYEAKRAYPGKQLHITNEIIHNPSVNQRLKEMVRLLLHCNATISGNLPRTLRLSTPTLLAPRTLAASRRVMSSSCLLLAPACTR